MKIRIVFLTFLFLLTCKCYQQPNTKPTSSSLTLINRDSLIFHNNNNKYSLLVHVNSDDNDYIFLADLIRNSIHQYSFPAFNLINEINLPQDNIVINSFYILTPENILVQDRNIFEYYILNANSEIIDSIFLVPEKQMPIPEIGNTNPVFVNENDLYFIGYSGGIFKNERREERPIITKINLLNKSIRYFGYYPNNYYKYNYGGLNYQKVYNTINTLSNNVVISFPASPNIYTFDISTKEFVEHETNNVLIPQIIPFSKNQEWHGALAKQDYVEYYYSNPSYADIYYDKYRNLYYRIVELPNSDFDYNKKETYFKNKAVEILNHEFICVGQIKIPQRIFSQSAFITEKGIYFLAFSKSNKDWVFKLFCLEDIV